MAAKKIKAGEAYVELLTKDGKLYKGLAKAQARLRAFGSAVRNIGIATAAASAAAAAPFAAAIRTFTTQGDELAKMSQRTGITVEALSELKYAAEQSGADLGTLETGVRAMQRQLLDASRGSKEANENLAALGLTIEQLQDLTPEQQFKAIADRLAGVADPSERAALAMKVLGKTGTELLPMMEKGAKGIEELQDQARRLGLTISGQDAEAAVELGDRFDDLTAVIKRTFFEAGAAVASTLKDLVVRITAVAVKVLNWIKANRQLVVSALKIVAVAAAVGVALAAAGTAIIFVGAVLGGIATTVAAVGAALGALAPAVGAVLSPIGLVITAAVALGAGLLHVSGAGAAALDFFGRQFSSLKETALAAFAGIKDAIAAGDIALAADILWKTLRVKFIQGKNFLLETWLGFKTNITQLVHDTWFGVARIMIEAWAGIRTIWAQTVAALKTAWANVTAGVTSLWTDATSTVEKGILRIMALVDESINLEDALAIAEQNRVAAQQQIEAEKQAAIQETDRVLNEQITKLGDSLNATLKQLDQDAEADRLARQDRLNAEVGAAEDELAKARQEWKDAIAKARALAANAAAPEAPTPPEAPKLPDFASIMEEVKFKTIGAFNPAAIAQALAGSEAPAQETAKNTARMVKSLDRIDRAVTYSDNSIAFA